MYPYMLEELDFLVFDQRKYQDLVDDNPVKTFTESVLLAIRMSENDFAEFMADVVKVIIASKSPEDYEGEWRSPYPVFEMVG